MLIFVESHEMFDMTNTLRLLKLNRPQLVNTVFDMSILYKLIHRMAEKKSK